MRTIAIAWTVAGIGLATIVTATPAAARSNAPDRPDAKPTCSVTWARPVNGSWNAARNWSPRRVPKGTDNVCITRAGKKSYVVTLTNTAGGVTVKTLTVGARTGKTHQKLKLVAPSNGIGISHSGAVVINTRGGLESDAAKGTSYLFGPGRLDNYGTLTLDGAYGQHNNLNAITNESSGKIIVSGPKSLCCTDVSASLTNRGAITVSSGGHLRIQGGTFTQAGGKLSNGGTIDVNTTLAQRGGHGSGKPVALGQDSTFRDTGGTGNFAIQGDTTFSGNILAGQTVAVTGYGGSVSMVAASNFTNRGTLVMTTDPTIGGTPYLTGANAAGKPYTLTNDGTFKVLAGVGADRFIDISITNDGTFRVTAPVNYIAAGTTLTNNGVLTVGSGDQLTFAGSTNGPANFAQSAHGTLDVTPTSSHVAPIFQPACGAAACQGQSLTAGGTLAVTGTQLSGSFPVMTRPNDDNGDNYPLVGTFAHISTGYAVSYNAPTGTDDLTATP